jgi:hypothetical protein
MPRRFSRLATHFRIPLAEDFLKRLSKGQKEEIKIFEQERDELEAADERVTAEYNVAHPTMDLAEGSIPRRRGRAGRSARRVLSSSPSDQGDGDGESGTRTGRRVRRRTEEEEDVEEESDGSQEAEPDQASDRNEDEAEAIHRNDFMYCRLVLV